MRVRISPRARKRERVNPVEEVQELIKDYGHVTSCRWDKMLTGDTVFQMDIILLSATTGTFRDMRSELYLQAESVIAILEQHYILTEAPRITIEGDGYPGSIQGSMFVSYFGR
jgi:hypothetical protein